MREKYIEPLDVKWYSCVTVILFMVTTCYSYYSEYIPSSITAVNYHYQVAFQCITVSHCINPQSKFSYARVAVPMFEFIAQQWLVIILTLFLMLLSI